MKLSEAIQEAIKYDSNINNGKKFYGIVSDYKPEWYDNNQNIIFHKICYTEHFSNVIDVLSKQDLSLIEPLQDKLISEYNCNPKSIYSIMNSFAIGLGVTPPAELLKRKRQEEERLRQEEEERLRQKEEERLRQEEEEHKRRAKEFGRLRKQVEENERELQKRKNPFADYKSQYNKWDQYSYNQNNISTYRNPNSSIYNNSDDYDNNYDNDNYDNKSDNSDKTHPCLTFLKVLAILAGIALIVFIIIMAIKYWYIILIVIVVLIIIGRNI